MHLHHPHRTIPRGRHRHRPLSTAAARKVPSYMSGKIMLTDLADKLASQAFFNPHIMPMISALLNQSLHNHRTHGTMRAVTSRGAQLLQSAHLRTIAMPQAFIRLCQVRHPALAPALH